jgi:RHS repeat-associated protein
LNSFPNFASASVKLNQRPLAVTLFERADPEWPTQWRSLLEIRPGPHTLEALAIHPSGHYQTNRSVTFTNNAIDQTTLSYFSEGQISVRIWTNLGQTNRIQTFTWDAKGRLVRQTERDASTNGYNWSAVYDPLGRKIRTTTILVAQGNVLTNQPKTIHQYYDPEHRFLELGVNVDGKTTWKLMGPDANGVYGGLQGIGGLDGVIDDINIFHPVISDARGNLLGSYDPVSRQVKWTEARPTGYGAIPEYRPVALVNNADLVQASAWQGRWPEITGVYWKGSRYYDPQGGYFLSHDPVHDPNNPSGYTYAGGDPITFCDPDGRVAKGMYNGGKDLAVGLGHLAFNTSGALGYAVTSPFAPDWAYQTYGQQAGNFGNTISGLAQTVYDVGAFGSYALVSPFAPDAAYNAYGPSMERLGQLGTALTGGEENSGAYRVGYTATQLGALYLAGRVFGAEASGVRSPQTSLWQNNIPGVQVRQFGDWWVKRVDPDANAFAQWWGEKTIQAQYQGLQQLGEMATPHAMRNGMLFTKDVGPVLGGGSRFFNPVSREAWLEGSQRMGTYFNDIQPRNMGVNGLIFDPAIDPITKAFFYGGAAAAAGYGTYKAINE